MVSCENLWKSVNNRDYARFWLDFSVSTLAEIDAFLENQDITPELHRRINHFQNLELLPMGMAPNSTGLEELYQYFAFQDFNINIFDCHDFAIESNIKSHSDDAETIEISEQLTVEQLFYLKQEIADTIDNSSYSAASQEFADLLFSKLEYRLHLTLITLTKLNIFDMQAIQALLSQTIQVLCEYFLMQKVRQSSFFTQFVFKGFLFALNDGAVILAYGLASRRVLLEEIVFGYAETLELHNLGCDVFIEHSNGRLSEVILDDIAGINISLRASDNLKLIFSNDVEYRKITNFLPLKNIPCSVEIDFSKPRRIISSNDAERTKRVKSRNLRVIKLLEQMQSVAGDKVISIDFSNVSDAIDSDLLNMISRCTNLQRINLSNADVSNADFT
ncbi:MAG: hypothetical protein KAR20_03185, partial [Candidatus Heimdallarchaeota archaeon]|nr:hypothetical protein [Candidatus Heimdallarchaeota archaeon]